MLISLTVFFTYSSYLPFINEFDWTGFASVCWCSFKNLNECGPLKKFNNVNHIYLILKSTTLTELLHWTIIMHFGINI